MDVEQREHVVSGFAFYSEKDARLAEQERQKIAYLDKRIDHTDIQSVLAIYKKSTGRPGVPHPGRTGVPQGAAGRAARPGRRTGGGSASDPSVDELCRCQDEDVPCQKTDPADAGRRGQKGGSLPVSDHEHRDDCGNHCHVCDHIEFRPAQYPELRAESSE